MGSRERPCQSSWFQKFLWLHYDARYDITFTLCVIVEWKTFNLFFFLEAGNVRFYHLMLKKVK